MNKSDKDHISKVVEMGCIVCRNAGYGESLAEAHHIGNGTMGKKASNREVIPLCPVHHRTGNYGVAVHAGRKEWEKFNGTEWELLTQTLMELEND
jgi:hypothetical protein